mgnify:CR=1 FL=1
MSRCSPSDDLLRQLFLKNFDDNFKEMYRRQLVRMPAKCLRIDHTFKIVANIGSTVVNQVTNRKEWKILYAACQFILNEHGQIVSWQFCESQAFEFYRDRMRALKERVATLGTKITVVYIDNCCQLAKLIREVLGEDVEIKLDPFHAIQRLVTTIPKSHPYSKQVSDEAGEIIRDGRDSKALNRQRTMDTPSPAVLRDNIERWYAQWKDVYAELKDGTSAPVLTIQTEKQVRSLLRHIDNGCLSGIPPGGGTGQNENLHRHFRSILGRSRLGPESAHALFTMAVHRWNFKRWEDRKDHGATHVSEEVAFSSLADELERTLRVGAGLAVESDDRPVSTEEFGFSEVGPQPGFRSVADLAKEFELLATLDDVEKDGMLIRMHMPSYTHIHKHLFPRLRSFMHTPALRYRQWWMLCWITDWTFISAYPRQCGMLFIWCQRCWLLARCMVVRHLMFL